MRFPDFVEYRLLFGGKGIWVDGAEYRIRGVHVAFYGCIAFVFLYGFVSVFDNRAEARRFRFERGVLNVDDTEDGVARVARNGTGFPSTDFVDAILRVDCRIG